MPAAIDSLFDMVADVLAEAAHRTVMPRFRALDAGDVTEKSPGELVSIADQDCERLLIPQLRSLLPGSRVVGEESASADPSLLAGLGEGAVWLLDPLDGTANFVAGRPIFAVMAALLDRGEPVGSWIVDPVNDTHWVAGRGMGAFRDGVRISTSAVTTAASAMQGAVLTGFLPPPLRAHIESRADRVARCLPGLRCAGAEYPAIVTDAQQFAVFWRTLPWDHVPGSLLLAEAGGHVARPDGSAYLAADHGHGLLAAGSREAWFEIRRTLFDDDAPG